MNEIFSRTEMLIGKDALSRLKDCRVAVFGIGGVGGYVAEALARSGVGALDLFDNDTVSPSNINRQIFALHSTVGKLKTAVACERLKDINPDIKIQEHNIFVLPSNIDEIDFSVYDYVIDAIDTVSGKIAIIEKATNEKIPVISSMGTGNKTDPTKFEITDIYKTSVCPLARVMRYEMKKRGIKKLKVLFSPEEPKKTSPSADGRKPVPSSIAFVPPVAGLIIAGEAVRDLVNSESRDRFQK
ncbi:MAG: tRNA threonylcarbamoyladenosine dehydratase [Clostridia bacterium]|nr:tRNA threonylcarbamoyladenosine dehydratase [Clostridia bacterium]